MTYNNINMFKFYEFGSLSNFQKWPKFDHFARIAHKIATSKYFSDILNDSDSPINYLSDDI